MSAKKPALDLVVDRSAVGSFTEAELKEFRSSLRLGSVVMVEVFDGFFVQGQVADWNLSAEERKDGKFVILYSRSGNGARFPPHKLFPTKPPSSFASN